MLHNFNFSGMLREMNQELSDEFQPGAFAWVDKKFNNAWSTLADRFERALAEFQKNSDYRRVEDARDYYKNQCIEWFKLYKREKNIGDEEQFFNSLK